MGHFIRNRDGFTLVEVIVATVLATIIVAGMLGVWSTVQKTVGRAERRIMAINFARRQMEELRSLYGGWRNPGLNAPGYDLGGLPHGELSEEPFDGRWRYNVEYGPNPYSSGQQYKIITVTVEWDEP